MACRLSILPLVLLFSAISSVSANTAICTIGSQGLLTMFNEETANVKLPCNYHFADFTCGAYNIKVIPGNGVDGGDLFSPDAVGVQITDSNDNVLWKGLTSTNRFNQHIQNSSIPVWNRNAGTLTLDIEDYLSGSQYAMLLKMGVFEISFAKEGVFQGVRVICTYEMDSQFSSQAYPISLCGDKDSSNVVSTRKDVLFGSPTTVSDDVVILHDILKDTTVDQSERCETAANYFQDCQNKPDIARICGPIFTDDTLAGCLINELDRFQSCMKLVCPQDCPNELQTFNSYVEDDCDAGALNHFDELSCL